MAVKPGRKGSDTKIANRPAKGGVRQSSAEPYFENANVSGTHR